MTRFPWRALREPLAQPERRRLAGRLRALVAWQRSLRAWPPPRAAPDAHPFVSLYVGGALRGCFGSGEGDAGERIARAFLLAAADARFPPIGAGEREEVVAQLSYCLRPRAVPADAVISELEAGTHGVAIVCADGRRTAVLPDVARDHGLTAARFVAAARAKIGLAANASPRGTRYFLFETEAVSSRGDGDVAPAGPRHMAAAWLARRIAADGAISFGVDAQRGRALAPGPMFHARCATAIEALAAAGVPRARAARAWLAGELARALRGAPVPGWPEAPAMVAGTLALAVRAGVDVRGALREQARAARDLASSPWHAAQVVSVLGADAPASCWRACVRDLDRNPVAPWTALAGRARGDAAVRARSEAALIAAVPAHGPHTGGVSAGAGPELALTAMVITALRDSPAPAARGAVDRAAGFLSRWQFAPGRVPASVDPDWALGAFPLSPIHHALRTDVTAHALLALN